MERLKKNVKKVLLSYRHLPDKKQYVEFFTALLTVPVLITVLALNLNSLKANNKKPMTQNTTTNTSNPNGIPEKIYISAPTSSTSQANTTANTSQEPCKSGIGSVSIDNPQEGDTVSDNPVSIDISYSPNGYCQVAWSYRINGGGWSDYDNKSIALYNLPQGEIKFELRVKSIASQNQTTLTRNFVYRGSAASVSMTPTGNGTKSSSTSAN